MEHLLFLLSSDDLYISKRYRSWLVNLLEDQLTDEDVLKLERAPLEIEFRQRLKQMLEESGEEPVWEMEDLLHHAGPHLVKEDELIVFCEESSFEDFDLLVALHTRFASVVFFPNPVMISQDE